MDKAQKSLIKTYYRKRNIAAKEDINSYEYEDYEVNNDYALKNNLIDINALNEKQRAIIFNDEIGERKFYTISKFFDDYALVHTWDDEKYLINKDGENIMNKLTLKDINNMNPYIRAEYINLKSKNPKFTKVGEFKYANNTIAVGYVGNDFGFVNLNGDFSVKGITNDDLKKMPKKELKIYKAQKKYEDNLKR